MSVNYDETDPISIEQYGKRLIGKTFKDICKEDEIYISDTDESINYAYKHENKKRKGGLGELVEERYFHYESNNDSKPDFDKAGVELKVTPYKINKNSSLSSKERLIISMIDYFSVVNEEFENSNIWMKARLILLIYYLYEEKIDDRLDYEINYVSLFSPPENDKKIIEQDFEHIVEKIKAGKAHELSEGDTLYLGAATKASSSKDRRRQPFSDKLAKPRAFSYKNSYMTYVLNNYIVPGKVTYEPIIKGDFTGSFEDYVVNKIFQYKGYSMQELCKEFNIEFKKRAKNLGARISYRILGIKGNHAEEFEKANIVIKTIRITNKNKIEQHMSFPNFKFKELIKEEWETSTFGTCLSETRFLFVVYKYDENEVLRLKGCQFWNMPYEDLNEEVYSVWNRTQQVIKDGLEIEIKNGRHFSNLPKSKENRVCHVRPHGQNSKDTYDLPDGRKFPKQSFWLNNSYILSQLNEEFLD